MVLPAYLGRAAAPRARRVKYDAAIHKAPRPAFIRIDLNCPDTYVVRAAGWKHKKEYEKAMVRIGAGLGRLDPRKCKGLPRSCVIYYGATSSSSTRRLRITRR